MPVDPSKRKKPPEYNFAEAQLHYLLERNLDPYSYSNSQQVTDKIEHTAERLDLRIKYLIEDLSILHHTDYWEEIDQDTILDQITPSSEKQPSNTGNQSSQNNSTDAFEYQPTLDLEKNQPPDNSKDVVGYPPPPSHTKSQLLNSTDAFEYQPPPNHERYQPPIKRTDELYHRPPLVDGINHDRLWNIELGVNLGHLAYFIEKNSKEDFQHTDLTVGFIFGLAGKWLDDQEGIDGSGIWDKRLQGPLTNSANKIQEARSALLGSIDANTEEIGLHSEIEDRLRQADFTPVFPLVAEVYQRILPEISDESETGRFISPYQIESRELGDLIWPRITELKTDERVNKAETLADKIESDLSTLRGTKWRTGEVEVDVLVAFWLGNGRPQSQGRDAHKILGGYHSASEQGVGKHLNDMAGRDSGPDVWTEYPLIEGNGRNRELTQYGTLLAVLVANEGLDDITYPLLEDTDEKLEILSPDGDGLTQDLTKEDILSACYALSLDHLKMPSHYDGLFEDAYTERIGESSQ